MADNAPSLSELTSIKGESSINPGVILDSRDAVHSLNQSAQFNAEMTQKRYAMQMQNAASIYQDLGAIEAWPIMPQDRQPIYHKIAGILDTMAEDPHAALGGPKFAEVQRDLGQVRMMAATSKQDYVYNEAQDKFLQANPDMDTPDNKGKVSTFNQQPLGQRGKFLLNTPVKFDPEMAMGKILTQKQVAVPYAGTSFEGAHNEWMIREAGTTYRRGQALDIWNQGYDTGTDPNNQPIKRWADEQFDKIKNDPAQMERFGNPKDSREFYQNVGSMMYGSKEDIQGERTSTRVANPYSMLQAKDNFALYMEGMKEGNREKLAAVRANLRLVGAPENANFLLRQYAGIVGNVTGQKKKVMVNGQWKEEDMVDVPANILKNYAETEKKTLKEGQSASPIVETITEGNQPDVVTRTADGNLRVTFYKRYDKTDKRPAGKNIGDIVYDTQGTAMIERGGVIPRRNLLTTLGKGVVETKILSSAIDQADHAMQGKGNDFLDQVNSGVGDGTYIDQAHQDSKPEGGKEKYPLPKGKPPTVQQGGFTYTWNPKSGKYE